MEIKDIKKRIQKLKEKSGSHSPSIDTLLNIVGEGHIKIDACFLSNPYATDLFIKHVNSKLFSNNNWEKVLEFYPPQNFQVAKKIAKIINVSTENIFVGNGAIEVIQALMHRYVKGKLCVVLPTFSPYYEYANKETEVIYYKLKKENDFNLEIKGLISFCKENEINNLILINPNNPNGGYIPLEDINYLLNELSNLDNVILDESFIHFAYEKKDFSPISLTAFINEYDNLSIIKSMSKDFGIAGIRCGYGVLSKDKVADLLSNGYLWNISGLANFFFTLYSNEKFQEEYEVVRKKYIKDTFVFIKELKKLEDKYPIKFYPSKSNFILMELLNGKTSFEFMVELLIDYGIYVRECSDKVGLEGQFIRIASRSNEENSTMLKALKEILTV